MLFLPANDLGQVRLDEEAHRHAGAVVKVGGLRQEPLRGIFNEAEIELWNAWSTASAPRFDPSTDRCRPTNANTVRATYSVPGQHPCSAVNRGLCQRTFAAGTGNIVDIAAQGALLQA
jgi:hypothetical protein